MIFDSIDNIGRYMAISENLAKGLAFVKNTDLAKLSVGRHEIDGDRVFAIVSEPVLKPLGEMKAEVHAKYADIQAPITGEEVIGVGELPDDMKALPIDPVKDIDFYPNVAMSNVKIKPGEFMVLFPRLAHGPACTDGEPKKVRKVVVKVAM